MTHDRASSVLSVFLSLSSRFFVKSVLALAAVIITVFHRRAFRGAKDFRP